MLELITQPANVSLVERQMFARVVTFREYLDVRAPYSVELGELAPDYDPSWSRDET